MRWKYFIPGLIVIVTIVVINILFMDLWLKKGLVTAGEMAFGAKVEVVSLKTKWSNLSLAIQGIAVANRDNPMQNLFELGAVHFSVQPLPLLSKKVIINEMTLENVRWSTARTVTGELPPHKQKKLNKLIGKDPNGATAKLMGRLKSYGENQTASLPAWQDLQSAKDQLKDFSLDKVIKPNELKTMQQLDAVKTEYQQKADAYKQKINGLNVNDKVQALQGAMDQVSKIKVDNAEDALAAKDKIENARKQVQETQALVDTIKNLKNQVQNDFGDAQTLTRRMEEWKNQDLAALSAKLKLPSFSTEGLARTLIGPMWANRIAFVLEWVEKLRQYMPPSKPKTKKEIQPRMRGIDVRFPLKNVLPSFWLKKALLSGTTGGAGKSGTPMDFQGVITDITFDPAVLGKPTIAEISGKQAARRLNLKATLDHTQEVPKDMFEFSFQGMEAAALKLPTSSYLPSFEKGQLGFTGQIGMEGDSLNSSLNATLSGLGAASSNDAQASPEAKQFLENLWKGIAAVQVTAACSGTGDNLKFELSSNLDSILAQRLQGLLGEQFAEAQKRLRTEVDRFLADKQKEALQQLQSSKEGTLGNLGVQEKQVQEKLQAAQKLIQQKDNAVQDIANKHKKQAEDELKNKAQDQLKNLFK